MSVFGIIVEGPRDAAVYPVVIRRIRPDVEEVLAEACGGRSNLGTHFVGWLKHFQYQRRMDKALIIRDADRKAPHLREAQLRDRLDESGFMPTFPVHFYATKCMLDSWLLADVGAICEVARRRGRHKSLKEIKEPLEEITDPKTVFERMLSQAGLPADDRVCEEIAFAANLERIALRCPYFRQFRKNVHAC